MLQIALTLAVLISKIARIDYPREWYALWLIDAQLLERIFLLIVYPFISISFSYTISISFYPREWYMIYSAYYLLQH